MFLKAHLNLIHIILRKEKLEIEIGNSKFYGFINIIGLNIVSRMKLQFALYATCLK